MLKFDFLIPTHNDLRDPKSIPPIVSYIKDGRIFRCADKPIAINQFQDGSMYVRDGHRRLCAMILAGARGLLDCEYVIEQMTYQQYMEVNEEEGWFTPFDPRTECRLANFFGFKKSCIELYESGSREYRAHIENFSVAYKEPRRIHSVRDLTKAIFPNGCN